MEEESNYEKPHKGANVLLLAYPTQGHINPLLQFSKRLASKGLKVTLITTTSISFDLSPQTATFPNLDFLTISDGLKVGEKAPDLGSYLERLRVSISQSLFELIEYYKRVKTTLKPTPNMVVYDAFMPYVLDVVQKCGLKGAPFFTQSCVVSSIYYYFHQGALITPPKRSLVSLPSFKTLLGAHDLPSFVSFPGFYPPVKKFMLAQFANLEEADYVFTNSVDILETEAVSWMMSKWPVKTIGPTIPSMYLDKRLLNDDDYGLSLFTPETNTCIQWLNTKESGSVVYVSMGSLASLGEAQMQEIAMGLHQCNKHFLWIVRASEIDKLPPDFKEKISDKGLIVNWCPQLEVLANPALGCFVTHCGWNSILESISLGVPMVAFPQWTDQPTNAKCVTDVWNVGVRVKVNENGIVTKEEIEQCVGEVMEGEKAKVYKNNASKLKQMVIEAMEEGGSSDRNIEEFVANLLSSYGNSDLKM